MLIKCSNIHFILLPLIGDDNPSIINHSYFTHSEYIREPFHLLCWFVFSLGSWILLYFFRVSVLIDSTYIARNSGTLSMFDVMFLPKSFIIDKMWIRTAICERCQYSEKRRIEKSEMSSNLKPIHLNIRIFSSTHYVIIFRYRIAFYYSPSAIITND